MSNFFQLSFFIALNLLKLSVTENNICPEIINRAIWGAYPAKGTTRLDNPATLVVIHHSATRFCINRIECKELLKRIQLNDMDGNGKDWDDIGYNFMIGGDGLIFEGRGWILVGEHAEGWNTQSLGVCLMGNFDAKYPASAQLMALDAFLECGVLNNYIDANYSIIAHRQVGKTPCPGRKLYKVVSQMDNFVADPNSLT